MAEEQKHIEIFTGSMHDLEAMTGRTYEAMKVDGRLMEVTAVGYINNPLRGPNVDSVLNNMAQSNGANAVVEVVYVPEYAKNNHDTGYIDNLRFHARGYCVKEVLD